MKYTERISGTPFLVFEVVWRISGTPFVMFLKKVWKNFGTNSVLFLKEFEGISEIPCLVFEVIRKTLGGFSFCFQKSWTSVLCCFWSSLKDSWGPFFFVFELIWKKLGEFFYLQKWSSLKESQGHLCLVFEVIWRISGTPLVLFLK